MIRITNTQKWEDEWFVSLTPVQKVVFLYLTDKCDDAGFIELNFKVIAESTGIYAPGIGKAIDEISKCYLRSKKDGSRKIWLKAFLKNQNKLPLDPKNDVAILKRLVGAYNVDGFDYPEIDELISKAVVQNKKKASRKTISKQFIEPTIDEYTQKAISKGMTKEQAQSLYFHYKKVGWVAGKAKIPIVDWEATITQAIIRLKKSQIDTKTSSSSKIGLFSNVREQLKQS